jgi:hypothetical protein
MLSLLYPLLPLAHAQGVGTVQINPNIPGSIPINQGPIAVVMNMYQYALMFAGLLVFGSIVWAGIRYAMAAGNPSTQSDARDQIWQALLGLVLLLGSYVILFTINPDLVRGSVPALQKINLIPPVNLNNAGGGGPGGNTGGTPGIECSACGASDPKCGANLSCSPRNTCVPTAGCCVDEDCPKRSTPQECVNRKCQPVNTGTIFCKRRGDCPQYLACIGDSCAPCTKAADCGGTAGCTLTGQCAPDGMTGTCSDRTACTADRVCIKRSTGTSGTCVVECTSDDACSPGKRCQGNGEERTGGRQVKFCL